MGVDVSGILAFGVKLPEEFKIKDADTNIWETIDDIFYPYDEEGNSLECKYKDLDVEYIGSCDDPEVIITTFSLSVEWTAEPVDIDKLPNTYSVDLLQFCEDFEIDFEPKWYLGCYSSY